MQYMLHKGEKMKIEWPKHACELIVTHNGHTTYYQSVGDYIAEMRMDDEDIAPDERKKCIDSGEIWELQWYPNTPVGFNRVAASTFEKALEAAGGSIRP